MGRLDELVGMFLFFVLGVAAAGFWGVQLGLIPERTVTETVTVSTTETVTGIETVTSETTIVERETRTVTVPETKTVTEAVTVTTTTTIQQPMTTTLTATETQITTITTTITETTTATEAIQPQWCGRVIQPSTPVTVDPGDTYGDIFPVNITSPGVIVVDYKANHSITVYLEYKIPYDNSIDAWTVGEQGMIWLPVSPSPRQTYQPVGLLIENRWALKPVYVTFSLSYYYLCPAPEPPPR